MKMTAMTAFAAATLLLSGCHQQATQQKKAQQLPTQPQNAALTENDAAVRAAACMKWPRELLKRAGTLKRTPRQDDAPYVNFPNAQSVTVTGAGVCQDLTPTTVMSATPIHTFPPHSITMIANGAPGKRIYMMWLMGADSGGNRNFIGMVGDESNLPLPDKRDGTSVPKPSTGREI